MVKEEDRWAVEAFDKLKQSYGLESDRQLAELLNTSANMLAVVRNGKSRPSTKLVFNLYDKLGWLKSVEGVAKLAGLLVGSETGSKLEALVLAQVTRGKKATDDKV